MNNIGTISWGVKLPYLKEGDDLVKYVVDSVIESYNEVNMDFEDCDVIAITESLLARTQGNYVTLENLTEDVYKKFGFNKIGLLFPITSRNRVANQLSAISQAVEKVYVQLSFPEDEVGNPIISREDMFNYNIDYNKVFSVNEFRGIVGNNTIMPYTGIDYLKFYQELSPNIEIILANNPRAILSYTKDVLIASVHRRNYDRRVLVANGANKIYDFSEILNKPSLKHGYNTKYGIYGANKAGNRLKLFPRDGQDTLKNIQEMLYSITGKHIEVMIYGDGAFKDPVCGIWELYDPCVSPFYSGGLEGSPCENKLKDLIDMGMTEAEINDKIKTCSEKFGALGTTPRRYTDLLGSLADLTSGSGDKGTPVVVIKNYFNSKKCEEIINSPRLIREPK